MLHPHKFRKYSKSIFYSAFLAVLLSFTTGAEAAVPKLLTYTGVLKNDSGNFLSGNYAMTFKLYNVTAGGTALWTESHSSVSVSTGKFSAELGSVTALTLDFDTQYYLGVSVGGDAEMTPRVKLTSVGYSYSSDDAINGYTSAQHSADSHMNVEGVKANATHVAKTNFSLAAYTSATASSMGDLILDVFSDATGIDSGSSSGYTWNGSPNFDITLTPSGGSAIEESTNEGDSMEFLSNIAVSQNGVGQQFQHASAVTVDKIAFKWKRVGAATGNVRFRLYSSSSGLPGTLLGETANIDVASQPIDYTEVAVSLTSAVSLAANTEYIAVIENIDAGTGDGTKYLRVRDSSTSVYANGISVAKNSGGSWATYSSSVDLYFKVYEQQTYTGSATVISKKFTEASVPSEAMIIAEETLGSGSITYSVSRDDGTTWTALTKETVTDISSQPSGMDVRWKAVITGDAELEGVALAL